MNSRRNVADSLSPEKLQLFAASLAHMPAEEMRKAKLLYVRNAISEFRALEKSVAGFKQMQGCLAIIPIFWPVIAVQKKVINAQVDLARERILNAVDVWKDDLAAAGLDTTQLHLGGDEPPAEERRFTV